MKNGRAIHLQQKKDLNMAVTVRASVHLTTVKTIMRGARHLIVATVRSVLVSIVTTVLLTVQMVCRTSAVFVPRVLVALLRRGIPMVGKHVVISPVSTLTSLVHTIMADTSSVVAISLVKAAITTIVVVISNVVVIIIVATSNRMVNKRVAISHVKVVTNRVVVISNVAATITMVAINHVRAAISSVVATTIKVVTSLVRVAIVRVQLTTTPMLNIA